MFAEKTRTIPQSLPPFRFTLGSMTTQTGLLTPGALAIAILGLVEASFIRFGRSPYRRCL